MKENLKIDIKSSQDGIEAQNLFFSLGYKWAYADRPEIFSGFTVGQMNTCKINKILTQGESDRILKEITLPELRELARPKEYLNDKFKLVVTNQPDDGWILVPEGANKLTRSGEDYDIFWKEQDRLYVFLNSGRWDLCETGFMDEHVESWGGNVKTLWQRENKMETVKGRFLHQEWLQKFIDGEDIEFHHNTDSQWRELQLNFHTLDLFNVAGHIFRLKPQTIQIGSRTINKPISVKPEIGQTFYVSSIASTGKFLSDKWKNSDSQNEMLVRNLCHLTAQDAINCADALLELMK